MVWNPFKKKTDAEKAKELRKLQTDYNTAMRKKAYAEKKAEMKKAIFEAKYGKYVKTGEKVAGKIGTIGGQLAKQAMKTQKPRPRRKTKKKRALNLNTIYGTTKKKKTVKRRKPAKRRNTKQFKWTI